MKSLRELDFNGDGWHIKVGQVYSSPYESNHCLVTMIQLGEDWDINDAQIYYKEVNPKNYEEVYESDYEQWHRAWWVNEGNWDLERDVNLDKF